MLHNTGPYGPNDTPVNVSSPINLGTPANISHNVSNLVKLSQPEAHSNSGPFDFQQYHLNTGNYSNGVQSFASRDSFGPTKDYLQSTYHQNGMLHDLSNNANSCSNSEDDSINHTKKMHEEYTVKDLSNTAMCDIDSKHTEKSNIADTKSSTFSNISHNNTDTSHLKSRSNLSIVSNIENITSRIISRLNNLSNKETVNNKSSFKTEDVQVNNSDDLIQLSDILEENDDTNDSSQYDSYSDDFAKENEDQDIVSNNNSSHSHVSEIKSPKCGKDDSEPLPLTQIKLEPTNEIYSQVVVKVEEVNSMTEMEHMDPFQKDVNGNSQENSSHCDIISSENSVAEATLIVQNKDSSRSDVQFECPHCFLLFKHPKRFLIHWKWHSFGQHTVKLSVEKKTKIKKRRQRKKKSGIESEKISDQEDDDLEDETQKDDGNFPCNKCTMIFESKEILKNHRHKVHPAKEHECKVCHKMFLTWHGMKTHMAIHSTETGVQCDECPKRFKHLHSLVKHKDTHKEKTHACSECPKKFGSQALLRMHMRCHERAQRGPTFRCTYCVKGFYTTYALQIHERTHRNEKPYRCDICDTSYGTNSSLKRHKKVSHTHSSLKPFECETCHRCFTTEFIRDKHAAREHGSTSGLQYACPMCTCRCSRLKDLQRHMYRAHRKGKKRRKDSDSE